MRDCDSIAVNAPDCGHEYTRRNDISVPLSTASATSCRAIPAGAAAAVAGGDQTVGIPTQRGLHTHRLLHRHQHTQVGHRIRRRPCRDPTLRHRRAMPDHDRRGTSPGCAASRAPTPARTRDAGRRGFGDSLRANAICEAMPRSHSTRGNPRALRSARIHVATPSVITACTAHPTDFNTSSASSHSIPNPASPSADTTGNRAANARSSSRSGAIDSPTTNPPPRSFECMFDSSNSS